ncbi:MAG: DNA primase [Kiritimatiellaeota bacterium]|nr:DNA primase [Kiritimatiellota bacterium]
MSGRIPDETIREIRDRSDIVSVVEAYVPLKRRGSDYWGLCPFHDEKTPSFKLSPSHQAFYCFGCQKSGNVFHFIMDIENVDFVGAVRLLAQRAGIVIPERPVRRDPTAPGAAGEESGPRKEDVLKLLRNVAQWYGSLLKEEQGRKAREYVEARGLSAQDIARFGLGYAPDAWDATIAWGRRNGFGIELLQAAGLVVTREDGQSGHDRFYDRFRGRLMFPIWDELGRVVGFSARTLDPEAKAAKYINTPETAFFRKGRLLYAFHMARQAFREAGHALVCEGQLDVIACHRAGLTHAVAPQGTAFTEEHARLLKRSTGHVVFAFDADSAGVSATVRSLRVSLGIGLEVSAVRLPVGGDPDSLLREHGPQKLLEILNDPASGFAFLLQLARETHDLTTPGGRTAAVREILDAVAVIPDPVRRVTQCQWLSRQLRVPEQALIDELNVLRRTFRRRSGARPVAGRVADPERPPRPEAPARVERARTLLLDLALHHGFIAHQLCEKILVEHLDNGAVSQALHRVLDQTARDNWETAATALTADTALARVPEIAKVLVSPEFPPPPPGEGLSTEQELRLERAAADCLAELERAALTRRIAEAEQRLQEELDSETARDLLREYQALIRQRDQLQRSTSPGDGPH